MKAEFVKAGLVWFNLQAWGIWIGCGPYAFGIVFHQPRLLRIMLIAWHLCIWFRKAVNESQEGKDT